MTRGRVGLVSVIVISVGFILAPIVQAEPNGDSSLSTVTVAPPTSGPMGTEGSAGYGQAGIQASASSTEQGTSKRGGGYYSGGGYTYQPILNNTVNAPYPVQYTAQGYLIKPLATPTQAACPPAQTGYYVYAPDGSPAGIVCVPNVPASAPAGSPVQQLAQQASSQQPWPNLVAGANPNVGVSGLASWFWLGGGSANLPQATASAGPLTVAVRASLANMVWDFGDGTLYDSGSSFGRPYPQQSDVTHIYQTDSYGLNGGYQLTVTLQFAVEYSVNSGPWQALGTKARVYSSQYPVYQVQPEGVATR